MPTICIDCRYLGNRPSGIGEVVQGLVDHLPDLAPDLEFLLLRNPRRGKPLSAAPNVIERDVPQAANGPGTMWWLSRLVDLSGVDLFHATYNFLPAGLRMPSVTTIHDVMWLTHPEWCRKGARGLWERAFFGHGIRRALRRSSAIATVSAASGREIDRLKSDSRIPTFVTLSGVSTRFAPSPSPAPLTSLGLAPDRRFILTIGQYAPYKNHEGAVRAFAIACADRLDCDLVLVQRMGSGARKLMALSEELGIGSRVHILSEVTEDMLLALYRGAAALLHPSFCEGFGNPLAEAMACGCPVVTSNVSAMPEVTAGAALTADPRDPLAIAACLTTVLDDRAMADTMRRNGLDRARQLSWRNFAAANLAIYRTVLLQDHSRRRPLTEDI